ncbi:MAG TPA: sigma-70 family RNA polymerase sigma factor [Pyrinomonadaceae bacterium]|nr:sigma-70 family RNA polymerase sigma factor [Pyrinomonadaceae bacterium]
MLRLTKIARSEDYERIFLAHYSRLSSWALALTNRDHERAEDLVHDAYIQFTLTRPDINAIGNLNGYFYTMLRNLHLSQVRRLQRLQQRTLSIVDYDSAELGLRVVDPTQQIRIQDDLRRVCQFACLRKETSKAGSVLILRFLHGYYPREIAQIMRTTRQAVEERLRTARNEAKQYLNNPRSLHFMRGSSREPALPFEMGFARTSDELLVELRQSIFSSRQGECLPLNDLKQLYDNSDTSALDQTTLAHVVSCRNCLDAVNALLNLPLLVERFPTDTLSKDKGPRDGDDGDDTGSTSGGTSENELRICKKRAREVFEHRPAELCISINGYLMAAQKIGSELNEQTLSINLPEKIDFIEVLGEQEIRLLFFSVDELPPNGAYSRSVQIELSDERVLAATLSFSNPWPTLQVTYSDPSMRAEDAKQELPKAISTTTTVPAIIASKVGQPRTPRPRLGDLAVRTRRWVSNFGFWLRPGTITAVVALIVISALVMLRLRTPTVSAAELLQRSKLAEETLVRNPDLVVHRTVNFEQRLAGEVISRQRIETWQSAARELKLRRLYDEQNNLIAGEWSKPDGTSIVYRKGAVPQARTAPEVATNAILETLELWRLDVSAKSFETLVGRAQAPSIDERADVYILTYGSSSAGAGGLLRASLTLRKHDLHATQQALTIQSGGQVREFSFVEAGFVQNTLGSVDEKILKPDPDLLGPASEKNVSNSTTQVGSLHTDSPLPGSVASHELEVEVTYLLNRIKANLGEQVSMTRTTGGKLLVEGLVETAGRKAEMLSALGPVINNPAVRVDVRTVAEAVKQTAKGSTPRERTVQEIDVANSRIPAESELRAYFSSRLVGNEAIEQEIDRYSNRVMNHSRQALLQASALKRLVERFSPADIRALSPEARDKWLSMIHEHTQVYRREVAALRQQLATVFGGRSRAGERSDATNPVQAATRLVELSYANDDAVRSAFTISADRRTADGIKSDKFWRSLAEAERLALAIQAEYQN